MAVDPVSVPTQTDRGADRGAVLVHVAVALIALMAFSTFVVDYGVMWVARRQAQNAADAAALAGAMAHAFDDPYNRGGTNVAVQAAFAVTQRHGVWGEAPSVVAGPPDITFPMNLSECRFLTEVSECISVDVYRGAKGRDGVTRGNPLPVFFGQLIGVNEQGVRATAAAKMLRANLVRCLRPWAIPDFFPAGNLAAYQAPTASNAGSTRILEDYLGRPFTLRGAYPVTYATMTADLNGASLFPLDLDLNGGLTYQANISSCRPTPQGLGDALTADPDDVRAETMAGVAGVAGLIAADAGAIWNPATMRIANSCAQLRTCLPYTISPRLVPVAVFDPKAYADSAGADMHIINILGFFVIRMNGDDVEGALTTLPGTRDTARAHISELAAFLKTIVLYR